MKIIRPVTIGDSNLTSSTVAEADYADWSGGTTYAAGANSMRAHRRWRSLQAANAGHDPLDDDQDAPVWWVDMGPTNRYAMFDDSVGTLTTDDEEIQVVIAPGGVDAITLLDTDAETAEVEMTVDGNVVFNELQTTQVGGQAITDWYLYFTALIGKRSTLLFTDLPIYSDGVITITARSTGAGTPVSIGTMAVGRQLEVGTVASGVPAGINDFSKKITDAFGNTKFVERSYAKRMRPQLKVPATMVDLVFKTFAELRATPIVWIASRRFDCLVVYGAWKSFEFDIQYGDVSYCSLEIEGLI